MTTADTAERRRATAPAEPHAAERPQQLVNFSTNEEWRDLVAEAAALIGELDDIEDAAVREKVFAALAAIDAVHREALHRLVRLFKEGVLEQVVTDPPIETLMGMYGLLPEPTPGCRKVWDFLGNDADATGAAAPRMDGAAGWRSARPVAADPDAEPPHWSPAPVDAVPGDGAVAFVEMEEGAFALAGAGGKLFAFDAFCGHHDKPVTGGRLSQFSFVCPHGPGCIYDIRDGARLGGGEALACRPVRIDDRGRPLIGFGMPFTPDLPAF